MKIQAAIVLVLVFFLMPAMSVPVSFGIISASLLIIIMFLTLGFGMFISAQKIISGIDDSMLSAVPFFVLAGLFMSSDGIAKRLISLAMLLLGKVPGSLAMTNITGNVMFGFISDSDIAAATVIGGVMLPLEEEQGCDKGFSVAVDIATAPVGQLIPPTASFIMYSAASGGVSAAALFMVGWVPGLLRAALCMAVACTYGAEHGYVMRWDKMSAAVIVRTIWEAISSLFLVVIVIGGILSGYFTPAEISGVAVVYALLLSVFIYKSIQIRNIPGTLVGMAVMTTIVILVVGTSSVLSFILSFTELSQAISSLLSGIPDNRIIILLTINITLLAVGAFMGMAPTLLIFTPIFLPTMKSLGMDPIQFDVMIVMSLSIGITTPSVGNVLFVDCNVVRLQVEDAMKKLPPSFAAIVAALVFVISVPRFSMWLPGILGLLK